MIRLIEKKDIPSLVLIAKDMHGESVYSHLDFSVESVVELCEFIIDNPETQLGLVVIKDGSVVGFAGGFVCRHTFGNDLTSGDYGIYLNKEHRKGMAGVKLIKSYTSWALSKGVKEPMLGISAGINDDRAGRLYTRLGYKTKFTVYKYIYDV